MQIFQQTVQFHVSAWAGYLDICNQKYKYSSCYLTLSLVSREGLVTDISMYDAMCGTSMYGT
jgi:hypothetical protein